MILFHAEHIKRYGQRRYLQGAVDLIDVGEVDRHIIVLFVEDFIRCDFVITLARVSLFTGCSGLIGEGFGQVFHCDTAVGQSCAVIGLAVGSGGEGDLRIILGDLQGANFVCNSIVIRVRVAPVDVIIRVLRFAYIGDGAGSGYGYGFTFRETFEGYISAYQSFTVIGFAG